MSQIFISYSRVDKPFVEQLHKRLSQMYPDFEIWFDSEDLYGGDNWWGKILAAIAVSDIFIYVLSNESIASEYCQKEFSEAQSLQKPIITILARSRTDIPAKLSKIQHIDMTNGVDDVQAIAHLNASIMRQLKLRESTTPQREQTNLQTSLSKQKKQEGIFSMQNVIGILGIVAVIVAAIINIMPQIWERWDAEATQTAIALMPSATPTDTDMPPSPTTAPTNTNVPPSPTTEPTNTNIPPSPTTAPTNNDIPPSPTTAPTNTDVPPSPTTAPTNTIAPQPSNTAAPVQNTRAYPCAAQADPNAGSSVLNVVRQFPNPTSSVVASVRRGENLTVIERSAGEDAFYRIQSNGRTIGWIAAEYLVLSNECPT